MEDTTHLEELKQLAMSLGATNVAVRLTTDIKIDEKLVSFCKDPRCPNYGMSLSCPPHVSGPNGFYKLLAERSHVVVIRIVVPASVLFSDERREAMAFLHEVVAKVERSAIENGFTKSKAFAGGSCKDLFCFDEVDCNVLSGKGDCRNPDRARSSMSGYGVNVSELIKTCGWEANIKMNDPGDDSMSWMAGIVLLG
jgi:predicted metal-binding protein